MKYVKLVKEKTESLLVFALQRFYSDLEWSSRLLSVQYSGRICQ